MNPVPDLFEHAALLADPPECPLDVAFEEWLETEHGQAIYGKCVVQALILRDRGFKKYGIAAIVEAIRYHHHMETGPDKDGYKVSHNHRSRLSRKIMADHPQLEGFFILKPLAKDKD